MAINKDTLNYVANLARIELSSQELEKLSSQLQGIVDFIDQLSKVDVAKVMPTSHILPMNNVSRIDSPCKALPSDKVLMNAPQKEGDFFVVPKVIEESQKS